MTSTSPSKTKDAYSVAESSESDNGPEGNNNGYPSQTSYGSSGALHTKLKFEAQPPPKPFRSACASSDLASTSGKTAFPSLPVTSSSPSHIRARVHGSETKKIHDMQQQIKREIDAFIQEREGRKQTHQQVIQQHFAGLQQHAQVSETIGYSVQQLMRMAEKLGEEVTQEEYREPLETLTAQKKRLADNEDEEINEILLLRSTAAALATDETLSVSDYSLEPPPPEKDGSPVDVLTNSASASMRRSTSLSEPDTLQSMAGGILTSLRKAHYSMAMVEKLMSDHPQWFNSQPVSRRINTHALRANYHGRKVHSWATLMRSSVFVTSSTTNRATQGATKDIMDANTRLNGLRQQGAALEQRKGQQEEKTLELNVAIARLRRDKEAIDQSLMSSMHVFSDPAIAETMLLLNLLSPVERLKGPIHEIRQWLVVQDAVGKASCNTVNTPPRPAAGRRVSKLQGNPIGVGIPNKSDNGEVGE